MTTAFEVEKRKRNLAQDYQETKGLLDGHCNRSACQRPLEGQPQWWMTDHESFTDEKLYYCDRCAMDFNRWDRQIGAPVRCTMVLE